MIKTRCLIIGSGPAGYTAAIYSARAHLNPILYEGLQPGGQLTLTTEVENFPGFPDGINGPELMSLMRKQAFRFNVDIRAGSIVKVDFSKRPFLCIDDFGNEILAETVIIATGSLAKWLGLESEEKFKGYGVSACATCDGFFYRNKVVAVVGGSDTACEEATYLSRICQKVYLIHRRDQLRASKVMQQKVYETPNISIVWNHVIDEIVGTEHGFSRSVNGIIIKNTITNEKKKIDVDGVFIAIGHKPNTDIFRGQIEMDEQGYIKTKPGSTKTNLEGVFAAGDVQDPIFRQAITAAGSGCMASIEAERFLLYEQNL